MEVIEPGVTKSSSPLTRHTPCPRSQIKQVSLPSLEKIAPQAWGERLVWGRQGTLVVFEDLQAGGGRVFILGGALCQVLWVAVKW